jgi:hypothetical protein
MDIKQDLENLMQIYGPDKVKAAAQQLFAAAQRPIPAEHFRLLHPDALADTVNRLDTAVDEVISASQNRGFVYGNKSALVSEHTKLETAVKLSEAEAFMNSERDGKEQYGVIDGKKIILNNDTNRDAYRRAYSANDRRTLASITGQIAAIDVELSQANDAFQAAAKAADTLAAKARLQAALLNYLAGRE